MLLGQRLQSRPRGGMTAFGLAAAATAFKLMLPANRYDDGLQLVAGWLIAQGRTPCSRLLPSLPARGVVSARRAVLAHRPLAAGRARAGRSAPRGPATSGRAPRPQLGGEEVCLALSAPARRRRPPSHRGTTPHARGLALFVVRGLPPVACLRPPRPTEVVLRGSPPRVDRSLETGLWPLRLRCDTHHRGRRGACLAKALPDSRAELTRWPGRRWAALFAGLASGLSLSFIVLWAVGGARTWDCLVVLPVRVSGLRRLPVWSPLGTGADWWAGLASASSLYLPAAVVGVVLLGWVLLAFRAADKSSSQGRAASVFLWALCVCLAPYALNRCDAPHVWPLLILATPLLALAAGRAPRPLARSRPGRPCRSFPRPRARGDVLPRFSPRLRQGIAAAGGSRPSSYGATNRGVGTVSQK